MNKKLYSLTERKLVLWCIGAMLLMSTSFAGAAYFAATTWLERGSHAQLEMDHQALFLALLGAQAVILLIGAGLSLIFAKRVLRPIRRAHQVQADFAANAHHQLNTPIAVMQAEVDTALLRKGSQDYKQVLSSIHDELSILRTTSERLLLLADDNEQKTIHSTSDDLSGLLAHLKKRYSVQIKTSITPDLQTTLTQDELTIILDTLCENTVKHAGIPLKDIVVMIALRPTDHSIKLIYADNGKGVMPGEEKRLFERNFRGKRAGKDGSGLGLSIVAEIAKTHNGGAKASSHTGGGLQITLDLAFNQKR